MNLVLLCIGLAVIGVLVAGISWRTGRRGRLVQGIALVIAPVALYLTGLLRLLWEAAATVVFWATSLIFNATLWIGLSLLALSVVLWLIGSLINARTPAQGRVGTKPAAKSVHGTTTTAVAPTRPTTAAKPGSKTKPGQPAAEVDPDLAEIEAILKNRGID